MAMIRRALCCSLHTRSSILLNSQLPGKHILLPICHFSTNGDKAKWTNVFPSSGRDVIEEEQSDEEFGMDDDEMNSDDDPDPEVKIGKQMLRLGRVPYRMIEPLPEWLNLRVAEVSSHRTTNQIRRCVKAWMLKLNREIQSKYAVRPIGWKNFDPTLSPVNKDVMAYGPEETVAYCHYFFPSKFNITRRIFRDIKLLLPKYNPSKILDFGCGPGTAGLAAFEVWGNHKIKKYSGIDMSSSMLDAAKIMTAGLGVDVSLYSKSADTLRRMAGDSTERYDMAIASYSLSEMVSDPARRAAVQVSSI
jgi:2-polyprenyl-3-methyl-5-hydroxy-6-metoxy-1,4-benzoquinol methylase